MRARIWLKFGTLKGLIKADLRTNFGRNPMNIHGVMTDYWRKIRSQVCHACRVNALEESVDNRGVASQKVMERQACPHETLKIIHDCKKKANDPMGG